MTFDPETQSLKCGHCEATVAVAAQEGHRAIVEYDLDQGLARGAQRGLGAPVRTIKCQECAATVSFPENVTSTACEFCGSAQVLAQESNRNLIRPESVVPFKVDGGTAAASFKQWLGSLWFRPSDLQKRAKVATMAGVYIPYWTFDAAVGSSWTAQAGYYYYETEHYTDRDEKGNTVHKTRQVRKVRWEPAWGSRNDWYDDVLVCASKGLPEELAGKLGTFNTAGLQAYDPGYLAGWKAEEYAIDLNGGWQRAVGIIESSQYERCAGDIPGDTHRNLHVTNRFGNERFKHVLLPLWISAFRYNNKAYRFLVNGQTGEVVGKAPWSVIKIVLFILAILLVIGVIIGLFTFLQRGSSSQQQYNNQWGEVQSPPDGLRLSDTLNLDEAGVGGSAIAREDACDSSDQVVELVVGDRERREELQHPWVVACVDGEHASVIHQLHRHHPSQLGIEDQPHHQPAMAQLEAA
jgi:hypothetical protein